MVCDSFNVAPVPIHSMKNLSSILQFQKSLSVLGPILRILHLIGFTIDFCVMWIRSLFDLPIKHRIDFKILLTTYKALNNLAPDYLSDLLPLHAPTRCLRSAGANMLKIIRTKRRTWGDRAFSAAAPSLWNALPIHIRQTPTLPSFKKALKTHLFKIAFNC